MGGAERSGIRPRGPWIDHPCDRRKMIGKRRLVRNDHARSLCGVGGCRLFHTVMINRSGAG